MSAFPVKMMAALGRLKEYIKLHRRLFIFVVIAGGILVISPLIILASYQVIEAVDSTAFCTTICHDVHYAETVTYNVSPHARVACANCHVGAGTENLVRSKLSGLKDILPTITGNYSRPIPTPLESQRPASETCETCHFAEKFYSDVPRITTSYAVDQTNTKTTSTLVLKVGGGKQEVAAGIHWHSTAKIRYLALDDQRLKIGWVSTEDAEGKVTEYIDPQYADEITPERIQTEKRLMDCVDCHNRIPHKINAPDQLIDEALTDGSIDASLPFIKLEALNALVPQNESLGHAYEKIARIKDFYKTSYPQIYKVKIARINDAIAKLREIAKLTTFENNLDWNTYIDQSVHDKPDKDMKVDFVAVSKLDTSAGCFRCHGNLVKKDNRAEPEPGTVPGVPVPGTLNIVAVNANLTPGEEVLADTGKLDAECSSCHYTLKEPLKSPKAPATSHPIDGLDNCLSCHNPTSAYPFKTTHPWSNNEACNTCHQSAPKLKTIPATVIKDEKPITHSTDKLKNCLACHGPTGAQPMAKDHPWATNDTCMACHLPASSLKVQSSGSLPQAEQITHPVAKLNDCLACHGSTAPKPLPADHPWSTNETCSACHQASSTSEALPVSTLPTGPEVKHSIVGLSNCTSCHNSSGLAPFLIDHKGRPDSFCSICHKQQTVTQTPAPLVTGRNITHSITGLSACSSCHYSSGPALLPTDHNGRPDSMCSICHKAGTSGTSAPPATPPSIPHAIDSAHQDCLSCHGPSGIRPVTASHAGRANSTCLTCHSVPTIPNAPANVIATAASGIQVNLTWVDNATNETGFRIQRATDSGFTANVVTATAAVNATGYNDTTVSAGRAYYYRVFATNTAGSSTASNTANVSTPSVGIPTPSAPTSLTAATAGGIQVNLTWTDNATNETGYTIQRATNGGFTSNPTTFTGAANATSYSDTTTAGSTIYYYRVYATNSAGSSNASNTSSVTTPAVVLDGAAIFNVNCTSCHGVRSTTMTQTQLLSWIPSHNTGSNLSSAQVTAVAQFLKGSPPSAPSGLTATVVNAGQVDLTWTDNATNETGYTIQRATNGGFTANLATFTAAANSTSYSDTTTAGSTIYYYRVYATNSAGSSAASNTANVTTPSDTIDAAALYSSNCSRCHGTNRQGGSGPALTTTALANRTVSWLTNFISGHRSGLTAAQVSALANFLKN